MNARWISVVTVLLTVAGLLVVGGVPRAMAEPVALTLSASPTSEATAEEGEPYKIGFCAAITGPSSSLGLPERNTAQMLEEQFADGIIGPDGVHHDLQFIIYDTESNPDTAASVANRLITEDEVDVLVCGSSSGNSMAMMPIATENEVPMISMASARAIIEDPETGETREWIFKTAQENQHSGEWQAVYLETIGVKTVCDLYENTGYGQDCLAQTKKALEDKGIELAYIDTFDGGDTEFPQLTGVQTSGCEMLIVGAIPPGASTMTVAAAEALPNIPIVQGHGVCNQAYIDLAGDAAEGVVFPCGRLMIADLLPDDDPQKPVLVKYTEDYAAFTDGQEISTFGGHAYDSILMVAEALSTLDDGMTLAERRSAIRDYLETGIVDWPGVSGVFEMTPDNHMGLAYDDLTFVQVEDGTWAYYPPEDWE